MRSCLFKLPTRLRYTSYRYCSQLKNEKNPYRLEHYMSDDEFRKASSKIIEFIIEYKNNLKSNKYPISPNINKYKSISKEFNDLLPSEFPNKINDMDSLLNDINNLIIPNMVHWESPNFYGWMKVAHSTYHNILSYMLMTSLSTVSFTYNSNPSATELEIKMLSWYGNLLNIPNEYHLNSTTLDTAKYKILEKYNNNINIISNTF